MYYSSTEEPSSKLCLVQKHFCWETEKNIPTRDMSFVTVIQFRKY